MPRGVAAGSAAVALVLAVVVAATAPDVAADDAPSAVASPAMSESTTQPPTTEPSPRRTSPTSEPSTPEDTAPSVDPVRDAAAGTALAYLADLDVKGRAPKTGYERDDYGQAWADVDRNGCDTRNDILRRDLDDITVKAGTRGCVVLTGDFDDPYGGRSIAFQRGQGTSEEVQIDHVVALSDSWQKGAQQWDDAKREKFANDPLNLLASDGPLNQQKGDGDAATWLPPNTSFRCDYVARQVAVKSTYGLWVTSAERDAIERVLVTCPDEKLPAAADVVPPPVTADNPVAEAPAPKPDVNPGPSQDEAPTGGGSCPVKGNHAPSGEWIYHVPGGQFYDVTDPEECFDTPQEAEAAGYRASKR
ncbi:DUF1524 domain-containing protein [Cellulosimicrobium terreum]|nr:DUF1524 domain-containing protein [Cellulosimicrobium terreum]